MARWKKPKPWKVSRSKLKLACDTLGLKHQVRIRDISGFEGDVRPTTRGLYIRRGSKHIIYLATNGSAKRASETLWHELAHAYQRENPKSWKHDVSLAMADREPFDRKKWWFESQAAQFDFEQYWNDPEERHARGLAAEMAPLLQLTYEV
jgi:hypothetical protein